MGVLELTLRVWLLFLVLSAMWWAGGAMLAAALPSGRVGWLVRTGLAIAGALAMVALNWIAWWLVVDVGAAGRDARRALEYGAVAVNGAAAVAALVIVGRRRWIRSSSTSSRGTA